MWNSYYNKNICILMIRIFYVIYENFYYMVFTRHSAGKILSSICIQNIVLHYQINPVRII